MSNTQLAVSSEESAKVCSEAGALLSGHFKLSSGLHSDQYFQCAPLLEDAQVGEKIAKAIAEKVAELRPTVIVSPALGAVLFGYELSRALKIRNIFAERPEGKFEFRRGFTINPGDRVVLAENVVTTGGSVLETAELVKSLGGEVVGYALIVDRSSGLFSPPEPVIAYASLTAKVFSPEDCPLCREGLEITKPGSRVFK